jgi:hypothetical protein
VDEQVFADGIGQISVIGSTVRVDFVVYSPTEKDPKGQPVAVFCQRLIMGVDGFLHAAEKIHEAADAVQSRTGTSRPREVPPPPEPVQPAPVAASSAPVVEIPKPLGKPPFP